MDVYFTIKFSCNGKAQVCFHTSFEVLMLSPLSLSDTFKSFSRDRSGCQDPERILPPGVLASWALGQLRAPLVTFKTAIVKKVRRNLSLGCPLFLCELLLC